jgi:hypothetical protein
MTGVAGRERALAPLSSPLPAPIPEARREGKPGQLVLPHELALADGAPSVMHVTHRDEVPRSRGALPMGMALFGKEELTIGHP